MLCVFRALTGTLVNIRVPVSPALSAVLKCWLISQPQAHFFSITVFCLDVAAIVILTALPCAWCIILTCPHGAAVDPSKTTEVSERPKPLPFSGHWFIPAFVKRKDDQASAPFLEKMCSRFRDFY